MERRKEDNEEKIEKCYIQADKPLAFNFYEVTRLEQLIDKEPTSGKKKSNKEKEEKATKAAIKRESVVKNAENEEIEKPKAKDTQVEVIDGPFVIDSSNNPKKMAETKTKVIKHEIKKDEKKTKIVIKYKKYTNSINVSNNKLKTIQGINTFLEAVLPELTFTSTLTKVELLQWIDISRNKLTDIHPDIATLPFLKILYVHGNNIQEIEKVKPLGQCKSLTNLTLYGNPIDHIKGYRHFIIEMVPLLEKFDSAVVSEKELDIIKFRGSRYGEKRNEKGEVIRYPKLPQEIINTIKQLQEESNRDKKDE